MPRVDPILRNAVASAFRERIMEQLIDPRTGDRGVAPWLHQRKTWIEQRSLTLRSGLRRRSAKRNGDGFLYK